MLSVTQRAQGEARVVPGEIAGLRKEPCLIGQVSPLGQPVLPVLF